VVIHGTAQIGHDLFAETGDEIEACRGTDGKQHRDRQQRQEVLVDVLGVGLGEAVVNHLADRTRQRQ
jgi:hypothetical protein